MAEEQWIVVPNWDKFQHYKDRDPRWIKDYTRQLSDHNYLSLSLRLRGILAGIRLLYAASGQKLGASPAQLGMMLGDNSVRMRDLISLSDAGLIELSASAHSEPGAILEEIKKEREEKAFNGSHDLEVRDTITASLKVVS